MMTTNRTDSEKEVFITHLVDAPAELVFRAWTEPEYLERWFAPDGCAIEYKSIEVREGGAYHSCLHDPVHGECWIKGTYYEVVFPERLRFSTVLTNEKGEDVQAIEAGKPEAWPSEIMTTVVFTALGNQTKVSLHQTVPEAEARKTGAYQSWLVMLRRLDAMLLSGKENG